MTASKDSSSVGERTTKWFGALIGPLFLVLAGWFIWGPDLADVPQTQAVAVTPQQISTQPLRPLFADPPTALIGGFAQACMDCHRFIETTPTDRKLTQHTHIVLNHGLNNRCLNCHHDTDRSKLVSHDGSAIGFESVEHLCAKCHGPTFRDWQKGMHGKTPVHWDPNRGNLTRLKCTHCHNPHHPAFDSMVPLPGPKTLRMGQPNKRPHDHQPSATKVHNPLRVWSGPHPPLPDRATPTDGNEHHD